MTFKDVIEKTRYGSILMHKHCWICGYAAAYRPMHCVRNRIAGVIFLSSFVVLQFVKATNRKAFHSPLVHLKIFMDLLQGGGTSNFNRLIVINENRQWHTLLLCAVWFFSNLNLSEFIIWMSWCHTAVAWHYENNCGLLILMHGSGCPESFFNFSACYLLLD